MVPATITLDAMFLTNINTKTPPITNHIARASILLLYVEDSEGKKYDK